MSPPRVRGILDTRALKFAQLGPVRETDDVLHAGVGTGDAAGASGAPKDARRDIHNRLDARLMPLLPKPPVEVIHLGAMPCCELLVG